MEKNNKYSILILEDELSLQKAVATKLEKSGFDVVTARSVEQGINFLKDIPRIDIIWLDHYLLGQKNGLDFVTEIKKTKKWQKIPVFVVSNTANDLKIGSYLALGVDKFYVKANCRLDVIIDDIKKLLIPTARD